MKCEWWACHEKAPISFFQTNSDGKRRISSKVLHQFVFPLEDKRNVHFLRFRFSLPIDVFNKNSIFLDFQNSSSIPFTVEQRRTDLTDRRSRFSSNKEKFEEDFSVSFLGEREFTSLSEERTSIRFCSFQLLNLLHLDNPRSSR